MKLKAGDAAPDFELESHQEEKVRLSKLRGQTVVLAFFPKAWTPVWTSQIPSYEDTLPKFAELNVQVLGITTDHIPSLIAWAESLGEITYPLLSDFWPHGTATEKYGMLREDNGVPERAIFIIDKDGIIRYISTHGVMEEPDIEVLFAELAKVEPARHKIMMARKQEEEEELPTGGVVLYCTRWCPSCVKVRKWLMEHQIEYVEVNVGTTGKAAEQIKKWAGGNRTTPTLDLDGTIVVGWDEEKVAEILGITEG